MSLEIQNQLAWGLGLRLQRWPKSRHVVLHVGRVESRVILTEERRSAWGVALLLLSGIFTGLAK